MKAYSEDLRAKIVEAVERGIPKPQVAHLFGVSLSSVKRYWRIARRGGTLTPKKATGRPPKADATIQKLLAKDVKERPNATVEQRRRFLNYLTGRALSNSTVGRLLRRLGFSRKKGLWGQPNGTSGLGLLGG